MTRLILYKQVLSYLILLAVKGSRSEEFQYSFANFSAKNTKSCITRRVDNNAGPNPVELFMNKWHKVILFYFIKYLVAPYLLFVPFWLTAFFVVLYMSHDTRKPVRGFRPVRHKPDCTATEDGQWPEVLD